MGQVLVSGENAAAGLESLLPVDLEALAIDQLCYTFFTAPNGGILDDLIVTRRSATDFMLVVNAACKQDDIQYLQQYLPELDINYCEQQALLALQGPHAEAALSGVLTDIAEPLAKLPFMQGLGVQLLVAEQPIDIYLSRSGYTGEDGFEISLPADFAVAFARELLSQPGVNWAGLGARDSLRLEAGLCLYGHDIDCKTTPVEAGLVWSIDKTRRRGGCKAGTFPGAEIIFEQMESGAGKQRVGFSVDGRVPVREGAEIFDQHGERVGHVTSGSFAPSLGGSVVMAYLDTGTQNHAVQNHVAKNTASADSPVAYHAIVRGKQQTLSRCKMPFVPHNYKRNRN